MNRVPQLGRSQSDYLLTPANDVQPGRNRRAALLSGKASGSASSRVPNPPLGALANTPGHSVPNELRTRVESATGASLGGVSLHTGDASVEAARDYSALAFTVGQHVHFGAGQYRPGTAAGDRLIAHELAHTIQQGDAAVENNSAAPQMKLEISSPCDSAELEADQIAEAALTDAPQTSLANGHLQGRAPARAPIKIARRAAGISRAVTDPIATPPADLAGYGQDRREALRYDTDTLTGGGFSNLSAYFPANGSVVLPSATSIDYQLRLTTLPTAADALARYQNGMKAMAVSMFSLEDTEHDAAPATTAANPLRNRVREMSFDLQPYGGANANYRFTCVAVTANRFQVMIEQIGAAVVENTAPSATDLAAWQTRADTAGVWRHSMSDAHWNKILEAMSHIPDAFLRAAPGIRMLVDTSRARGPGNEDAEFGNVYRNNAWTHTITVFSNGIGYQPSQLAQLLSHEFGHAISARPTELPTGPGGTSLSASPAFAAAVTADGGWAAAPTAYGATSHEEFFAEAFGMFISRPTTLMALRPNIYKYFVAMQTTNAAGTPPAVPARPGDLNPNDPNAINLSDDPLAGLGL